VRFVAGNAEALPAPDRSADAVTVAFGIRNVPRLELALAEARRVLRPGGRLMVLEFSAVDVAGLDWLYDAYSLRVIPRLGELIVGNSEPYRYLVESIRRFPGPERFADMLRAAGLRRVSYRRLSGGIAAIHSGWRL
jgi:demethylmenaquinone methyltransferase/2-methoxy-6-polyprenyl-1,4-benzoquinol methylase